MKNSWNKVIYACWSPVYGYLINLPFFKKARRKAIQLLNLQPDQHLLIVGIGTGADLSLIPAHVNITGADISCAMLKKCAEAASKVDRPVELTVADAAHLPFHDNSFDAVLLFLILSVVEDASGSLREVQRVTRHGAQIVVFDKFLDDRKPSMFRRLFNPLTRLFGTDMNRKFEEMNAGTRLIVEFQETSGLGNAFKMIRLCNKK